MKGLILKELYLIKSFSKQYVLLMVLMGAWSIFVHNISFVAIYVMVLGSSMVPVLPPWTRRYPFINLPLPCP